MYNWYGESIELKIIIQSTIYPVHPILQSDEYIIENNGRKTTNIPTKTYENHICILARDSNPSKTDRISEKKARTLFNAVLAPKNGTNCVPTTCK